MFLHVTACEVGTCERVCKELLRLQMMGGAFARAGQKGQQQQIVMWWNSSELIGSSFSLLLRAV